MTNVHPTQCACREEEQASKAAAAKQEAKRRKKAKDKVKAQQAKIATAASAADHPDAPSQPANGSSNASKAAAGRSESNPSHDTDAISPHGPSQRTDQQQHESGTMQPTESGLALQPEIQQASSSVSAAGHDHQQVELAAAGSSSLRELSAGHATRGHDRRLLDTSPPPGTQSAIAGGELLPPMQVPKRRKQRSKKGKQPAAGPETWKPAARASSLDGVLPRPGDEDIPPQASNSNAISVALPAIDAISPFAADHKTPPGAAEPALSAAAVMAAASGQSPQMANCWPAWSRHRHALPSHSQLPCFTLQQIFGWNPPTAQINFCLAGYRCSGLSDDSYLEDW